MTLINMIPTKKELFWVQNCRTCHAIGLCHVLARITVGISKWASECTADYAADWRPMGERNIIRQGCIRRKKKNRNAQPRELFKPSKVLLSGKVF